MKSCWLKAAWLLCVLSSFGAGARTKTFVVSAPSQSLATDVARLAETYRRDLAIEWLGQPLADWRQPCPIHVTLARGAGGATSFMFDRGRPFGWTMSIQGSRERILDSVLPHEVTHTIFATHFGKPLPRWADEGACTTVEDISERRKQDHLLVQFLTTRRGIPFNQMFAMKEYPRDILPLYSQGYSLARFLIAQGGKRKYIQYVGDGMQTNDWSAATRRHYGYQDLSELQVTWNQWVAKGSPAIVASATQVAANPAESGLAVAAVTSPERDRSQLVNASPAPSRTALVSAASTQRTMTTQPPAASTVSTDGTSWYARQRDQVRSGQTPSGTPNAARPTQPQTPKQAVLQWNGSPYGNMSYGNMSYGNMSPSGGGTPAPFRPTQAPASYGLPGSPQTTVLR